MQLHLAFLEPPNPPRHQSTGPWDQIDPGARAAYGKLLDALGSSGESSKRASVARRLIALDLLASDSNAATRHMQAYQAAGGTGLSAGMPAQPESARQTINIPGPLRSFGRMAAISSDLTPGRTYTYTFRATGNLPNGQAFDQTRQLKVIGGEKRVVDFFGPPPQ